MVGICVVVVEVKVMDFLEIFGGLGAERAACLEIVKRDRGVIFGVGLRVVMRDIGILW